MLCSIVSNSQIASVYMINIEEFRKNPDNQNWENISCHQKLSEEFIREFQHKVKWRIVSYYQTLSESFIREFQDKVDWYIISYKQKL